MRGNTKFFVHLSSESALRSPINIVSLAAQSAVCQEIGIYFISNVVEFFDGESKDALRTLSEIGCLQTQEIGHPSICHFFHKFSFSVCLWREMSPSIAADMDELFRLFPI